MTWQWKTDGVSCIRGPASPELDGVTHSGRWINALYLHYMESHYKLSCHVFPGILPLACLFARRFIKNMSSSYQQGIFALLVTLSDRRASGIFHREKPFQVHTVSVSVFWEVQISVLHWWGRENGKEGGEGRRRENNRDRLLSMWTGARWWRRMRGWWSERTQIEW